MHHHTPEPNEIRQIPINQEIGLSLIAFAVGWLVCLLVNEGPNLYRQWQWSQNHELLRYIKAGGQEITAAEYQRRANPEDIACYRNKSTGREFCVGG